MKHFKIPVTNGTPDIDDYRKIVEAFQIAENERYIKTMDDIKVKASWVEITEAVYNAAKPAEEITTPQESQLDRVESMLVTVMTALPDLFTAVGGTAPAELNNAVQASRGEII